MRQREPDERRVHRQRMSTLDEVREVPPAVWDALAGAQPAGRSACPVGHPGPCPHGDLTCPCQDGDPCHYEELIGALGSALQPMRCPRTGIIGCTECQASE